MRFSERHVQKLQIDGTECADSTDQVDLYTHEKDTETSTRNSIDIRKVQVIILLRLNHVKIFIQTLNLHFQFVLDIIHALKGGDFNSKQSKKSKF